MSRRTIALVLAVVLAGLATIALISYIQSYKNKFSAGKERVQVFVAKQDIPAGVSGDTASQQGLFEERTVTEDVKPDTAIQSLQEVSGKIAAVTIFKDEIIVAQRFVTPGGGGLRNVLPIPQGRQAVSVQVAPPAGVAGFIQPGDQVSLISQVNRPGTGAAGGTIARFLLQRVDVLAVGSRVVSATTTPAQGTQPAAEVACCLLTLALTPGQAEQLVFASLNGQMVFTLLPQGSPQVNTPGRTIANLFN